jgi:hypothetical protein
MKRLLIFLVLTGTVFGQSNIRYDNYTHAVQKPPTSSGSVYDYDFTGLNIRITGISGILPVGGTTGQKLVKLSNTDYDVGWATSSGVPGGSNTQFQINNSGAFGGTGVYTTNGTFVTVQADNVQYVQSGAGTKKFTLDGSHITAGTTRNVRIADANSATVIPASATANNYVTNIDATGTQQIARPTFTNMSDKLTDGQAQLLVKPSVTVVSDANVTLSGTQTIDGVLGAVGAIVLATAQSTASENGPWVMEAGAWGRPSWYASGGTAYTNSTTTAFSGTAYSGSTWRLSTPGTITIDTLPTTWVQVKNVISSASTSNGVTGTGAVVLATSPTLVTPLLGTPTSGNFSTGTFTWPTFNQNTTGSAAKLTTARAIGGVNFDGTAAIVPTNISGGNSTTLLGSIPYQSNTDTTTQLAPNTTTTKKFLRETGDGTNGTAPAWDTLVAGDVPTLNQNTTGSAATLTTARNLWGQSFNGSAAIGGAIELGTAGTTDTTLDRVSAGVASIEGANILTSGGALGTPASGTLTNCTALPVSGITSSTSTALGVGSIELGAASDTTIARSGAGAITVEGTQVILSGAALGTPASGVATNLTGTADGLTAGDVTRNHAVYAGASPPTVDVGLFTIAKTGVNLKASGNTTGFVVPTGRAFLCTASWALVTSVTTPGAGTETWTIKESAASATMLGGTASGSGTPAVGTYYSESSREAGGPYTQCAAGNTVTIVVATSQAGSTAVTGTVFIQGFYTQ